MQILRPDTKVVRGGPGDAGPQVRIDDTTVAAASIAEADDWASMVEIAVHDPGNTAGRSLAYIGLVRCRRALALQHVRLRALDTHTSPQPQPLSFARAHKLQLTSEEEEVLREKEAQYVPPAALLGVSSQPAVFKSPDRTRPGESGAARAISPLRETSMIKPGGVIHSGWLWRKGMMNNWKKKWFTIVGSSIYYADSKVRGRFAGRTRYHSSFFALSTP